MLGVFARSLDGVDFASLDGAPTRLFFALIAPQNAAADHLKALARISRLLKDEGFRRRLIGEASAVLLQASQAKLSRLKPLLRAGMCRSGFSRDGF